MKPLVIIALVLLLLIAGLPLAMGMDAMEPCPACTAADSSLGAAMCLALLALGGPLLSLTYGGRISTVAARNPRFLTFSRLDRPPQYA